MPTAAQEVFELFSEVYDRDKQDDMSLQDYLLACREDPMVCASAPERMIAAAGEPEMIDTSSDPRLGRIILSRTIKVYPAHGDSCGIEGTVQRIVGYFQFAAQGLEERKQILYLLGPIGGGKSSLAECLKQLMEALPFYVLKAGDEITPVYESPLGLFDLERFGDLLEPKYCIAKAEPGDENNQDISALVGKVDIRQLEHHSQNDPDAYSYSGGLNATTQGLLEFVEMFKAPIKMLHPLLTATQEGNYLGTENFGALPFQSVVLAHSNEAEWEHFRNNKNHEAFLDRICVVKVPYCLRVSEEAKIYRDLLTESELGDAPSSFRRTFGTENSPNTS